MPRAWCATAESYCSHIAPSQACVSRLTTCRTSVCFGDSRCTPRPPLLTHLAPPSNTSPAQPSSARALPRPPTGPHGVAAGPRQHGHSTRPPNPGPLVQAYDGLGTVQPIVFGYLAEASAGACDLIKSVADELAPRYADLYLLESVEAAVGIATDRLREEIGAAVFKAQARVILDRIRCCYRGTRAADARRHLQQARWRSRAAHARSHGRPRGRYSLLHRRP